MIATVLNDLGYRNHVEIDNGKDALDYIRRGSVDFLITGVQMPRMDGLTLLRNIRKMEGMRLLPVIVVTSNSSRECIMEALSSGADDYLIKPIAGNMLKNSLLRTFRKRGWH